MKNNITFNLQSVCPLHQPLLRTSLMIELIQGLPGPRSLVNPDREKPRHYPAFLHTTRSASSPPARWTTQTASKHPITHTTRTATAPWTRRSTRTAPTPSTRRTPAPLGPAASHPTLLHTAHRTPKQPTSCTRSTPTSPSSPVSLEPILLSTSPPSSRRPLTLPTL